MEDFKLKLGKPLCFFDLETTGLELGKAKIIEIAILKVNIDNSTEIYEQRINPQMPIPQEVVELTHICDSDVANCPTFKEVARDIVAFIGNSDLAGYNSNHFDVPMLMEEFIRADIEFDLKNRRLVDVQNIFQKMEPRTLSGACKFYLNKKLEGAHGAKADTIATYEVFKAQIERYKDSDYEDSKTGAILKNPIVNDIKALSDFSTQKKTADLAGFIGYNKDGKEVFNFGKYKSMTLEEVFRKEPAYYKWIQDSDFPLYTKRVVTRIYTRGFQTKLDL